MGSGAVADAVGGGQGHVLRIGYQKFGSLSILKARGTLEKRLKPLGYTVQWDQFLSGPPLVEALNAGSIDIGHTGETPPVVAQAAGVPFDYIGSESPSPQAEAILVPKGSAIRSVADLKGRTVSLNKGSAVHYLFLVALKKAGIKPSDVTIKYLSPPDGRAAFEQGSIDAWVIWDPYYASAQRATGARILEDGRGLVAYREFYLGSKRFVAAHPDIVKIVIDELDQTDRWSAAHKHDVAALLSPQLGLDVPTLELAASRRVFGAHAISPDVIAYQQNIADSFYAQGLLPRKVVVKDAVAQ